MADPSPLKMLSDLLRGGGAEAVLAPQRIAASTIYDVQYRLVINACVFERLARAQGGAPRRVSAAKQKLVQFVAIRPWLITVVRSWSLTQHEPQLSMRVSQRLRRGFLSDTMHDSVIAFMVAGGVVERHAAHLTEGVNRQLLRAWSDAAVEDDLFKAERAAIDELRTIRITNDMLEGW